MKLDLGIKPRKCPNGFLEDYLTFTNAQESPEDFHLWTAFGLIASALGRNISISRGYFHLFPNLYIVLVAESAALHKSTALNMGMKLLKEALPEKSTFSQKVTTEALINFLAEQTKKVGHSVATIAASEFSVFFGKSHVDPTLIQTLTDLYDSPAYWSYKTIMRGLEECQNVAITMLAGTTPDWIKSSLPEDSIGGGFTSRLLMVNRTESEKQKNPFPEMSPEAIKARENCVHDLKTMAELVGELVLTPEAREFYIRWYDIHDLNKAPVGMRGYYGRKGDYLLKLAGIISISKNNDLRITKADLEQALFLLNDNEDYMADIMRTMAQTDEGKRVDRVRTVLRRNNIARGTGYVKGCTHSSLMQQVSHTMTRDMLNVILQTLELSGEVKRESTPRGGVVYLWLGR